MKNILKFVVPAVALALCLSQSATAQVDGYRFGVGLGYSGYDGGCGYGQFNRNFFGLPIAPTPRIDQPPFFAMYPPVYYSKDIIARPYGVSPFAAPSGITPVEMGGAGPILQANPYYVDPNVAPLPQQTPAPDSTQSNESTKSTWVKNPYYDPLAAPGESVARN